MATPLLIACDFDGTATQVDTLGYLSERFSPEIRGTLHEPLMSGAMSLREVIAAELSAMGGDRDEIVRVAVEEVPLREGFREFVASARGAGHRFVVVSAGFQSLIRPMLAAAGVPDDVEVVANDVQWSDLAIEPAWRDVPFCDACSQHCKRGDLANLRSDGAHEGDVVFIGDGFSDRCGAEAADRIFARDDLALYLREREVPFEPYDDFWDVARALGLH